MHVRSAQREDGRDQTGAGRVGSGKPVACEKSRAAPNTRARSRNASRATPSRKEPTGDAGVSENGLRRRDGHVAGHREVETASQCVTVDECDDTARRFLDALHEALAAPGKPQGGLGVEACDLAEIRTRGERSAPVSFDHQTGRRRGEFEGAKEKLRQRFHAVGREHIDRAPVIEHEERD